MEKYCRSVQIIDGELDNQQIMMHLEKMKYFGLNPVGKKIWEIINEPKSLDEIVEALLKIYSVDREQCLTEVEQFLNNSVKFGAISVNEVN